MLTVPSSSSVLFIFANVRLRVVEAHRRLIKTSINLVINQAPNFAIRAIVMLQMTIIETVFTLSELEDPTSLIILIIVYVDRLCGVSTAYFLLATLNTRAKWPPLKVEKGYQHDREANVNSDDHWPLRRGIFCSRDIHPLEVNLKAFAVNHISCTTSHDVDFICARERVLDASFCYDHMLYLLLIHPETWVEGTPELDFTTYWDLCHCHVKPDWKHGRPNVRFQWIVPRIVL